MSDKIELPPLPLTVMHTDDRCRVWPVDAMKAYARAAVELDRKRRAPAPSVAPVAWMTEDGERVVTDATRRQMLNDGGACASSIRPYNVPLCAAPPAPSVAVSDGGDAKSDDLASAGDAYRDAPPALPDQSDAPRAVQGPSNAASNAPAPSVEPDDAKLTALWHRAMRSQFASENPATGTPAYIHFLRAAWKELAAAPPAPPAVTDDQLQTMVTEEMDRLAWGDDAAEQVVMAIARRLRAAVGEK